MNYNIRINFNGFTCWMNELITFLNNFQFENMKEGNKLYYESFSSLACYNFRIISISHDEKIVELIAE